LVVGDGGENDVLGMAGNGASAYKLKEGLCYKARLSNNKRTRYHWCFVRKIAFGPDDWTNGDVTYDQCATSYVEVEGCAVLAQWTDIHYSWLPPSYFSPVRKLSVVEVGSTGCGIKWPFIKTDDVFVVQRVGSQQPPYKFLFVRLHDPLNCTRLAPEFHSNHARIRVRNRPHLAYAPFEFEVELSAWWQMWFKFAHSHNFDIPMIPRFVDLEANIHRGQYPCSYDDDGDRRLVPDYVTLSDANQGTKEGLPRVQQEFEYPHFGTATCTPTHGQPVNGNDGKTHADLIAHTNRLVREAVKGVTTEEGRGALFDATRQALATTFEGTGPLHQWFSLKDIALGSDLFITDMFALLAAGEYPKLQLGRTGTDEPKKLCL
jgi:hypothetical protein